MSDPTETSFLSRWSRRKAAVREGKAVPSEPAAPPAAPQGLAPAGREPGKATGEPAVEPAAEAPPAPTLADVAMLKPGDSVARFVSQGVDETVKRAALKTLFADPHFNVMDGLDIYIDDYSKPDPIPPDVLRRLRQSETLGLFDPVEETTAADAGVAPGEARVRADDAADVGADGGDQGGGGHDAHEPRPVAQADDAGAHERNAGKDDGKDGRNDSGTDGHDGGATAVVADVDPTAPRAGPATDKPA